MDEWVHCPAARLSSPSAIQVGNWVLIECNVREEKQQEQMQTQKKKEGPPVLHSTGSPRHQTVGVHHEVV